MCDYIKERKEDPLEIIDYLACEKSHYIRKDIGSSLKLISLGAAEKKNFLEVEKSQSLESIVHCKWYNWCEQFCSFFFFSFGPYTSHQQAFVVKLWKVRWSLTAAIVCDQRKKVKLSSWSFEFEMKMKNETGIENCSNEAYHRSWRRTARPHTSGLRDDDVAREMKKRKVEKS